jgi:2-phospho-L-lactate guanylyltransferase
VSTDDLWAVVPIKELAQAKQRLAPLLTPQQRSALAEAMARDVLGMVARVGGLAGILVVTADDVVATLARRLGARIVTEDARAGYTPSVATGVRVLMRERCHAMLTLPADVPAASAAEVEAVLAAHAPAPAFTIVPAHDEQGSNAIACSPPDAVALRFLGNSFTAHLDAARDKGIVPAVVRQPGLARDIDHPTDIAAFLRLPQSAGTATRAWLEQADVPALLATHGIAAPPL